MSAGRDPYKDLLDITGRWKRQTDGAGNSTDRTYDAAGSVLTETVKSAGSSLAASTTYQYDLAGNALRVTDGLGNYSQRTYDALGHVLTEAMYAANGALTTTHFSNTYCQPFRVPLGEIARRERTRPAEML